MPGEYRLELFDFGLDPAQEERAHRLHRESIIIDMLFQGPIGASAYNPQMVEAVKADYERHHDAWRNLRWAWLLGARMAARGELPEFKECWDASGITAGNRQLETWSMAGLFQTLAVTTLQFDRLDWLIKALSADDIRRAKAEGKHAGFVSAQDTVALGQDLDNLDLLYEFGLRILQLSYNNMNFVAAGCTERTDAGVSNFGVKFIERMNKLGIVVDTGHCGHQTTMDACAISSTPVIASHSCARALSGHARGKRDEALAAIAATGGVIGVVAVPFFLAKEPGATVAHLLDHVDYIAKLVGHEHVGIGTDWPMSVTEEGNVMFAEQVAPNIGFRPEDQISTTVLEGFGDYREFVNITRGLVARGYSDAQIKDILGGNWLRIMDQVWRAS